jgi:hypothetical protein
MVMQDTRVSGSNHLNIGDPVMRIMLHSPIPQCTAKKHNCFQSSPSSIQSLPAMSKLFLQSGLVFNRF